MLQYTDELERSRVQAFRAAVSTRMPFNFYFQPDKTKADRTAGKLHLRRVNPDRLPQALPDGCIWVGFYQRPCPAEMFLDDLRAVIGGAA